MGNDMFNEEQLADAKVRADAAVFRESLTPDLGFDFVAYAREVLADKDHKDRDDLSCLAMEIMGALVSSIDRLQGRLDSLHRSKVEYGVSERLKLIAAVKANAAEADRLRLALAEATRERENWIETARTYAKGEDYYRGLIDAALKDDPAAYVADDGSISEDVLRAKLPEMYALAVTERKRAEAEVRFPANEWVMWPLVRRLEETLTEKEAEIATLKAAPAPLPPEVREAAEALRPWLVTNPEVWDRRGLTAVAEITKRGRRLLAALAARRGDV